MKTLFHKITIYHLFLPGLILVLLSQIPMLVMGTDAIVPYHDQLDGELIAYIYQAKYLFSGQDIIPEFLNGASKTSLIPPAPFAVLFFCLFTPFDAYMVLQILGQTIAYAGMFCLTATLSKNKLISLVVALLYCFLPFLPVYGLSQYGIPLLLLCFYNLYRKKYRYFSFLYISFYTAMSSLILCGFLWIIVLGISLIHLIISAQLQKHLEILGAFFTMLFLYILENLSLLKQLFSAESDFVSHKSEYTLTGYPFISSFWGYLSNNDAHSTDYHVYILFFSLVLVAVMAFCHKRLSPENHRYFKLITADLGIIVILCGIAALWDSHICVSFRMHLGSVGSFQLNRILWAAPALWYIALALCLSILWSCKTFIKWINYVISVVFLCILSLNILKGSTIKPCLQELLLPDYETISWSDYLAIGVMNQVEDYLKTHEDLEKDEYKVASLGIDPSAALYHGFYCVDGYSNNYDVEYKHAFRKIIASELSQNDWLKEYYDTWGNRCYLFSSEIPGYYNIEKGSFWYNNLQIDTTALSELGCDYILSAAYIVNAEDLHLELLQENAFETDSSYYRIYIYKLNIP